MKTQVQVLRCSSHFKKRTVLDVFDLYSFTIDYLLLKNEQ